MDGLMNEDDKPDEQKSIVEEAKSRFQRARDANSENRLLAIEDTKFVMGDSDNGWQWPLEIRNARQSDNRVCLTVNMTAQHCNQVINNIRQNRPQVKVIANTDGSNKQTAEILSGLIRNIQTSSNADDAHDVAAEHAIYGGEGYWRVITDYESPSSFDQIIKIKQCPNPQSVIIDPDCLEMDRSDAGWGVIYEDISKEQMRREHPDIDATSWNDADPTGWVNKDTVRRAEYFYCTYVDDMALALSDGTTALKSTYQPKPDQTGQTPTVLKERKTSIKKWHHCQLLGGHDQPINEQEWLGQYLPIISVIGKELNVNGEIIRKGLVRDIKDPARMANFSFSETVQTLALQNKVPYMAAAEAIEGYEDVWQRASLETRAYLPYNAYDDGGNPLPRPERQAPAVMPDAQVRMLELSTEQMRAASGQQNSNFGIKSEASSGIGIARLKQQGEVATFHFPDNLRRALQYEGKVLIDLIQKYYDTKRIVRILDLNGTQQQATLDPEHPQAYQEHDIPEAEDVYRIFNPQIGTYDVSIDTGPSYQTQRQESFEMLSDIASRNPQLMQVAGDLIMRASDIPMADQIATRLEKTLPPGLQDKKGQPKIPPEAQQQLQHLQQQSQQLEGALNNASEQVEKLEAKADIEWYRAETDRIKVQSDAAAKMAPINNIQTGIDEVKQMLLDVMRNAGHLAGVEPPEPPGNEPGEQNQAPSGAFSLPEQNSSPPAMAATGAQPGLA
jgi:hypothetical protein